MRRILLIVVVLIITSALPGVTFARPPRLNSRTDTSVNAVTLVAKDIAFQPSTLTVAPGTMVTLVNQGALPHNFSVDALHIGVDVAPGDQTKFTIPIKAKPGTYDFYCNLPGHRQAGMVGKLIISRTAASPTTTPTTPNGQNTGTKVSGIQATIAALQTHVAALQTQAVAGSTSQLPATVPPAVTEAAGITGTPVALATGVDLLYQYTEPQSNSELSVLGEYRNSSDQIMTPPVLQAMFLDAEGNILASSYVYPLFPSMAPGARVPFDGRTPPLPAGWTHLELHACQTTLLADSDPTQGLKPQNVQVVTKSSDELHLAGEVANSRPAAVQGVLVKVAVYRSDGRYAGSSETSLDVPVPPGKTERFDLDAFHFEFPGIDPASADYTYKLWVGESFSFGISC